MGNGDGKEAETGKTLMRELFDVAYGEIRATLFEDRTEEKAKVSRATLKSLARDKLKGLIDALFSDEKKDTDKKTD